MGDYLKQVEDQLVEMTERGAHHRPHPRLDAAALVAAIAVVAAVAFAVATIGKNAHRPTPASHRPHTTPAVHKQPKQRTPAVTTRTATTSTVPAGLPPAGGPVPAGFGPQSFTAISEYTWWLLGDAPCSSPPCTSIVRTT